MILLINGEPLWSEKVKLHVSLLESFHFLEQFTDFTRFYSTNCNNIHCSWKSWQSKLERGDKALLLSCIALNYLWLLTYSSPEATICCLFAETRIEVEAMGISKSCISSILLRIPNNQRKYASSRRGQLSSPDNKMRFLMLHFLPLTFQAYD